MLGLRTFYQVAADVVYTSSTVLTTIGLSSPIAASQKQNYRAWIPFTLGATGGFKVQVVVPAGGTLFTATINLYDAVGSTLIYDVQTASAAFGNALAAAGDYWAEITGFVLNGATAGNIDIQCAQNSSSASALTVLKGGYMDVIKS